MPFGLSGNSSSSWASAQPHSDLLRFPKPPPMGRFLLACVGKPIAVTAGKQASRSVQLGDPATAIHPVCGDEHTNQGRSPPSRHGVQAMATCCSTSLQSSPHERLRYFSVTEWRWVSTLTDATCSPSLLQPTKTAAAIANSRADAIPAHRWIGNPRRYSCRRLHSAPSIAPSAASIRPAISRAVSAATATNRPPRAYAGWKPAT